MTLDKLLIQVRRIAEHRQLGAEKQIRAAYKRTLNDLKKFIGYEFAQYAEDGKLTYDILAKKQSTARFLEEVQQNIDGLSPETQAEILQCVSDIYGLSYEGMTNAALKTAPKAAADALQGLSFVQPTQVISSVNNELINKITLNDVLEKNRRNVIYDLKQAVTIGITNGETVDMMSRRVSGVLDGDYKKAVRVVRTEAHRVREMGLSDSAKSFDEELQKTDTGFRMVKIWRTMKDERVRPNRRYKTKKGWRTSVGSGANHQKMEGQTVLATDMFELTDGHKTVAPGQSGIAAQDINCRCFVQYKLVDNAEFVKLSAKNKFTNGDNSGIIKAGSEEMYRKVKKGYIEPMPKKQLHRIEKSFKRQGRTIHRSVEIDEYLKSKNAEAITYNANTILLRKSPGRASVFEELIHATQYKNGENDGSYLSRLMCEIAAQRKLIDYCKAYQLTRVELEQTKKALNAYEKELKKYKQGGK